MLNSGVRNSVQSQSKSTSESMVCMRERTKRHGKVRSDKWKHKEFGFTVGSKFPQSVTHSSPSRSSRTELLDENSTLQEMQTPEYMEEQCILSTNETKNKRRNGKSRKTWEDSPPWPKYQTVQFLQFSHNHPHVVSDSVRILGGRCYVITEMLS